MERRLYAGNINHWGGKHMQAKLGNDAVRAKRLENGCVDSHIDGDRYGLDIAKVLQRLKI
jgi:hypothetical protein